MSDLRLVIFDVDGVLVDSETVINRVLAEHLTAIGWPMTTAECQALFTGMALTEIRVMAERRLGPLPIGWSARFSQGVLDALAEGVPLIPGAVALLETVDAMGLARRVASNSSRDELALKFARTGLDRLISPDRIHSVVDMLALGLRGKPAPDLFLAAAAAEGVSPADCVVVEDSVPGACGARAAGMRCYGYAPHGGDAGLREAGAGIIRDLAELPAMFQALRTSKP